MILIQHVKIRSTQWDRGAEGGALRNAVPRQFPVHPPGEGAGWLQHVLMDADDDYTPRETWTAMQPGHWCEGFRVNHDGDFAEVMLDPESFNFHLQKPKRPNLYGLIARLPFGQRLLLRVNTAVDGHHARHYFEHAVHVAFAATVTLDLPLFREIDERAILY